jgi:hypothetical protein
LRCRLAHQSPRIPIQPALWDKVERWDTREHTVSSGSCVAGHYGHAQWRCQLGVTCLPLSLAVVTSFCWGWMPSG